MKILIDKNNLLVIENPNIPQLKEYDFVASGYRFSDYDKGIIVYHKKEFKIVNLKNLGNNMNIFYVINRENLTLGLLDGNQLLSALSLFSGWDENIGKKYFFIPRMKESDMNIFNQDMEKLGTNIKLEKSDKGIIVNQNGLDLTNMDKKPESINEMISFLFALTLIYGKMDTKNNELIGIKIHIPLFGQYMKYKEDLENIIKTLQEDGIFLNYSILQNKDGIIYQINSSDYELLGSFANFYQSVEKVEKILKQDFTEKVKSELLKFIEDNDQIPEDGKEEVLKVIEDGIVKILVV